MVFAMYTNLTGIIALTLSQRLGILYNLHDNGRSLPNLCEDLVSFVPNSAWKL
jgi:hypothetical protein